MTKEQRYLIQVLNDFIHHRKSTVPEGLDLTQLQQYGKNHEVLGIIFYQTGLSQFRSAYLYTIYAYEVRRNWASKLTETLSCPWFFVKGLGGGRAISSSSTAYYGGLRFSSSSPG